MDWEKRFNDLEVENKKLRGEFDGQRAKFKEIFMQKQRECEKLQSDNDLLTKELNDCKSEIMLGHLAKENDIQEVESLNQFVQNALDESSSLKEMHLKLKEDYEKVKQENFKLTEMLSQQSDTPSLAPVLNHVKKFAMKFGSDQSNPNENLEDSMRKAQEDAEVLRSLVEPLEEEIKALKEKLRSTDEELQKYLGLSTASTSATERLNNSTSSEAVATLARKEECSLCKQLEDQLSESNKKANEDQVQLQALAKQVMRLQEDLERESILRRELEKEWQEKREQHKETTASMAEALKKSEDSFAYLHRHYNELKESINRELLQLTQDRENVDRHLKTVQEENEMLAGIYLKNSQELDSQDIDLPDNIEELHEMLLKANHNLIQARVGFEKESSRAIHLDTQIQRLYEQLDLSYKERQNLNTKVREIEAKKSHYENKVRALTAEKAQYEAKENEFKRESSTMREQEIEMLAKIDKLEKNTFELKSTINSLKESLTDGEKIQQDFVRLSQNLQMQLEKIRVENFQVRWLDDEDIDNCNNCKVLFTVTRRKQHCRHCGTIFCDKCVSKTVPAGPRKRPAHVCDVCHTLLMRNTAPYFSEALPETP